MDELALPLPPSEERFWRTIGCRLVSAPGLSLAVVPCDLNSVAVRARLRRSICDPDEDDRELIELAPDGRQVASVDLACGRGVSPLEGADVLPRAFARLGIGEDAQHDAEGEEPRFLLVNGIAISSGISLSQWVRDLVAHWPGGQPGGATSRLHCCCIVSAELPQGQAPLPEGCEAFTLEAAPDEEIRHIVRGAVATVWHAEDAAVQQYLCSGIADMASGLRSHAGRALQVLQQEWEDGATQDPQWRPIWRVEHSFIQETYATMESLGITRAWVRERLCEGISGAYDAELGLARRLWERGLWRSIGDQTGLWQGLTMVARAAIKSSESPDWLLQPPMPDAAGRVLLRTLRVEQQLKHHLLRLMEALPMRKKVDDVLDKPRDNGIWTLRSAILKEIDQRRNFWERRFPYVPLEQRDDAAVLVTECSFNRLQWIFGDLIERRRSEQWRSSLNEVVTARNSAAHGGWFSLEEYRAFIKHATRVEADLMSLRFA